MSKSTLWGALLLAAASGLTPAATAQSDKDEKKTTIEVRVVEEKDGKTIVDQRSYRLDPMSDADQQEFVDKVLDSMKVDGASRRRVSITVDDDGHRASHRSRIIINGNDGRPRVWSWQDGDHPDTYDFRLDTRELEEKARRIQKDIEPRLKELRTDMEPRMRVLRDRLDGMNYSFGDGWGGLPSAGSVRSLNAYPNNPDNGVLNLRFSAPETGDVRITVTDTEGREVGRKTIKDFSGQFVGQIELKKNTKGTLFVTVVQNDDGNVRKVVID